MELLFGLILELAEYEKLADKVEGSPEVLRRTLFEQPQRQRHARLARD